jgi:ubiquinone/menaquinone biosynthesis C-methylase UbiE
MPPLDSPMHVRMLDAAHASGEVEELGVYGLQWGNPQVRPDLRHIRDRFIAPYINPDHVAVEIGPGGGRWTRYMLGFATLYAVDYHDRLLTELAGNYRAPHLRLIKNSGSDFPGIPENSVDYIFSCGVFVHLDIDIIEAYFRNMRRILKASGCAVIQYSDKNKEVARRHGSDFSDTTPEVIRPLVIRCGFGILEEDTTTLRHSSVVRCQRAP